MDPSPQSLTVYADNQGVAIGMFIQMQIVLSPNVHLFSVNCIHFALEDHGTFKITLYWRILHRGG